MRRRRFRPTYTSPQSLLFSILALGCLIIYFGFDQVSVESKLLWGVVGVMFIILLGVGALGISLVLKNYRYQVSVGKKLEEVDLMSGPEFEAYIAYLLKALGYEKIKPTGKQGDFGVDILFSYQGQQYAAQLKRYRHTVGVDALYQAVGGQQYYQADHAALITTAHLTSAAAQFADKTGIFVVDRKKLGEWIEFVHRERQQTVEETTSASPQS